MAEEPDRVRAAVEADRERLGETAEALAYKADVPSRAKESIGNAKDTVMEKISGVAPSMPDSGQMKGGAQQLGRKAQSNPFTLGIGAMALGLLAGALLPETRMEEEKIGPAVHELKQEVQDAAQHAGEQIADQATSPQPSGGSSTPGGMGTITA